MRASPRGARRGQALRGDRRRPRSARVVRRRRPALPGVDPPLPRRGVGERARCPRGDLVGDVGEHQHHARDARSAPGELDLRSPGAPRLGPRPGRDHLRPRRRDDEPRRRLALHRARPDARARRHDRAAAFHAARGGVGSGGLGRNAAFLLGVRVVPPDLPPQRRRFPARWSSCSSTACSRVRCSTR